MKFDDFIRRGQVRGSTRDISLAKSLVLTARQDLQFLKSLPVQENSARKVMSNYYDVLRSVLESVACLDGYKIYSHDAFTYFLKEKGEERLASLTGLGKSATVSITMPKIFQWRK